MLSQLQLFENFIGKAGLFLRHERILLAVSGGKDSVAMVHLFAKSGFDFAIAHCNFQLRGEESLRDERFVQQLAHRYGVPFHSIRFDTEKEAKAKGQSIQMVARELRYGYFYKLIDENAYDKIATAHHQNDAVETVLFNLIRGTGMAGLHGIRAHHEKIIRPLLCFCREDIDEIVDKEKLVYVEDSSNQSVKYTRNKIRHQIIPVMMSINSSFIETMTKNVARFSEMEDFLNAQLQKIKSELLEPYKDGLRVSKVKIRELEHRDYLLRAFLSDFGFNETIVNDLLICLKTDADPGRLFFSENYVLNFDRDYLFLGKRTVAAAKEVFVKAKETEINFNKLVIRIGEADEVKNVGKCWCFVDADKLKYPLSIRYWKEGDRFLPLGMNGQKKVSDFFIHQKIPVVQKNNIPVLTNGDGKIIWIVGWRTDDRFKVTEGTKKITTFEIINPEL